MPSVGQQKGLVGIRLLPQGLEETFFFEYALKLLLERRPDFDIDAVSVPEMASDFPMREVRDALGNVKEMVLGPGVATIDASALSTRVEGHGVGTLMLPDVRKRRKVTLTPALPSLPAASTEPSSTPPPIMVPTSKKRPKSLLLQAPPPPPPSRPRPPVPAAGVTAASSTSSASGASVPFAGATASR